MKRLPTSSSTSLTKVAVAAIAITLVPQGVWLALMMANLRSLPSFPWSILVMAGFLVLGAQYLGGRWGPSRTVGARRQSLRATVVSLEVFRWAMLAGALSLTALAGVWIVFASIVRMPGSVLPDLSRYPRWTAVLAVAMGALISPLCEQAGIWGFWQGALERRWSASTAIVVTSIAFALMPHPPPGAAFAPKLVFFFLTGLTFSTLAYLTNSILPGIPVHAFGLLTFFVLVWPDDPSRRLITSSGTDAWFWVHVTQIIVFAVLAVWAFGRLAHAMPRRIQRSQFAAARPDARER